MSGRASIAIATGGTGGHVFPALAFAESFKARANIHFITDVRGARYGTPKNSLILSMPHGMRLRLLRMLWCMPHWLMGVTRFYRRNNVRLVVTFGSYAAIPAIIAARLLALPLIIHEQNAVMGRVNRYGGRLASKIALSFEGTEPQSLIAQWEKAGKASVIGVPTRQLHKGTKKTPSETITIGVLGGSQGARSLSQIVPAALAHSPMTKQLFLLHQARDEDVAELRQQYRALQLRHEVASFFDDMSQFYSQCDVLIARAGASTLAEAAFMEVPLILIPYPYAAQNHQDANAAMMAKKGAAIVIKEGRLASERLHRHLARLLIAPDMLQRMRHATKKCAHDNAAEALALLADDMMKEAKP